VGKSDVIVMIPTLNEAKSIGKTVADVKEWLPKSRILVLDSHSDDGTADIAMDKGAMVVNCPRGGKGLAVRSVLQRVLATYRAKCYVMMDGDYTYPAKHIPEMIGELKKGAGVVIGYRDRKERGAMSLINTFGNTCLSRLASLLYRHRVKDVCSGMWAFRLGALSLFHLTSNGFTLEADLFVNTMRSNWKLVQVPIEYRARLDGSTAKLGITDGFRIAWFLLRTRFKKQ